MSTNVTETIMKNLFAALLAALSMVTASAASADTAGEIRAVYDEFRSAQNARDLTKVKALLLDSPGFLWVSDGKSFWGPDALDAWHRTVENFLSHDKSMPSSLAQALEADPNFTLAWCAKGLFAMLLARADLTPAARDALGCAEASARSQGATARERLYLEA